jgi:hypothetical protein
LVSSVAAAINTANPKIMFQKHPEARGVFLPASARGGLQNFVVQSWVFVSQQKPTAMLDDCWPVVPMPRDPDTVWLDPDTVAEVDDELCCAALQEKQV